MGNQRRSENTTPEQREFVRLFPGLSACLDSLAKDLDDADAVCKQQLEEGGRIPIPVPTLDQKSPAVVFVSVREAMLRSSDAVGDETVAAANKIINNYRNIAGAAAISCFDKMLSVAQGSVHTVAPPLAKEVRSHLSGRWEPANVLRLISLGGVLPPAFSPDHYDVDAYVQNQIRGLVLSRFDSHVQRLLNDATVEEQTRRLRAGKSARQRRREPRSGDDNVRQMVTSFKEEILKLKAAAKEEHISSLGPLKARFRAFQIFQLMDRLPDEKQGIVMLNLQKRLAQTKETVTLACWLAVELGCAAPHGLTTRAQVQEAYDRASPGRGSRNLRRGSEVPDVPEVPEA